jgi:hypothetical protein
MPFKGTDAEADRRQPRKAVSMLAVGVGRTPKIFFPCKNASVTSRGTAQQPQLTAA